MRWRNLKNRYLLSIFTVMFFSFVNSTYTKEGGGSFYKKNFACITDRVAAIDEVKKLGGTPLDTVTDSVPDRISAIENYISQGVDAIILCEGDIKMVSPALEEAKKRGIIIASVNSGISDLADIITENNDWVNSAVAATELMVKIQGKGKIVEIYNDIGQMIRARRKILHAVISEYPGVEIAAGLVYTWPDYFPDMLSKMEAVLKAHPDIVGGFATFEGVACAAAQAIREAGLQDQIVIVTPSCSPLAYEEMRKPDSPLKLVMEQDPDTMAREAVRMAFKLLNGEEVPRRHIFIPAKMITIENISESQFLK